MKVRVNWDSATIQTTVNIGGQEGLNAAAHAVHRDSQQRTPIQEGLLRAYSGVTIEPGVAYIAYGMGPTEPYAVVQHEHTEFNHPNGGEAKFLENALNEFGSSDRLLDYIARSIKL